MGQTIVRIILQRHKQGFFFDVKAGTQAAGMYHYGGNTKLQKVNR